MKVTHIQYTGSPDGQRNILIAVLRDADDEAVKRGSIAEILQFAKDQNFVIENAQEVLHAMVIQYGFAA